MSDKPKTVTRIFNKRVTDAEGKPINAGEPATVTPEQMDRYEARFGKSTDAPADPPAKPVNPEK